MEPTSLSKLMAESGVSTVSQGLSVFVHPEWIVDGEHRLSYTSLTRLVECCREHHWNVDVISNIGDANLDSITKSFSAEFHEPIPEKSTISIVYAIEEIRSKGYSLLFTVSKNNDSIVCAEFDMSSVFYDPEQEAPIEPPTNILDSLSELD